MAPRLELQAANQRKRMQNGERENKRRALQLANGNDTLGPVLIVDCGLQLAASALAPRVELSPLESELQFSRAELARSNSISPTGGG